MQSTSTAMRVIVQRVDLEDKDYGFRMPGPLLHWRLYGIILFLFIVVLGANALIFVSWRIPAFHGTMEKFFVSGLESKGTID